MKSFLIKLAFKMVKDTVLPMVFDIVNRKVDELGNDLVYDNKSPVTLDSVDVVTKHVKRKAEETLDEVFARFE